MQRLIITLCLTISLACGSFGVGLSGDFQKGWEASVKGDYATVLKEWIPLAAQGNASAQFNLGVMYAFGEGVIEDIVYAHMWFDIATANGDERGQELKEIFTEEMTPSQIEKAQDLARECVKKDYKGC